MNSVRLLQNYRKYPALWLFIAYGAGISVGYLFLTRINIIGVSVSLMVLFITALVLYVVKKTVFIYAALLFIFVGAMGRIVFTMLFFETENLINKKIEGQSVVARGRISETHYRRDGKNRYLFNCEMIKKDSVFERAEGRLLLLQGKYRDRLSYGEEIEALLPISLPALPRNPGEFNYRRYLQMKNVYYQAYLPSKLSVLGFKGNVFKRYLLAPVRRKILSLIERYVSDPANGIMKAVLLGEKQDIDKTILNDFQRTGVIHVLAISGLHVGIILAIFLFLFSIAGLSYNKRVLFSIVLLVFYMALVDFRASVVRATLMAAFYFGAQFLQRKTHSVNILAAAGLLILLVDPRQLFSMGFQFSFISVFSILYGYPRLAAFWTFRSDRKKWKIRFNTWFRQPLLVSLCAVAGIAPLTWYYFGTFQIGAVLANLFIIPLFTLFLGLTFIFLLLALFTLPGAAGLAYIINQLMLLIVYLIQKMSHLSFIQIYTSHPSLLTITILSILILLVFNVAKKSNRPYLIVFITLFGYLFMRDMNVFGRTKLKVTYVDVGQGDAAIVTLPNGTAMVIDGGMRQFKKDAGRRFVLPVLRYYGIHHIKYLIGSHSHSDHIGGLISILQNMDVDSLVLSGYAAKTKLYKRLLNAAVQKGVPVVFTGRGEKLNGGDDTRIYILHPDSLYLKARSYSGNEVNNSSLVLKICYGKTSFLFTGDLERNAEPELVTYQSFLQSNVLKVAHHGSKTSTSLPFLQWVHPQYSIVSVGKGNKFHHPNRKTIVRLRENNARPLRTDLFGALVFESDGESLRLFNWRK